MSIREQVNTLLFGGQHDAIIRWLENQQRELAYYRMIFKYEGDLMSDKNNVVMEGVQTIFRNFSGRETDFNQEGRRNFCILLDDEIANAMQEDGWNVKWLDPRENADEGETPQAFIQIKMRYDKGKPPKVVLITSRGQTHLEENEVEMLDWADIKNVDLIFRPFPWTMPDGRTGVSAYLQSLYVTIEEDELERKYADVDAQ